MPRLPVQQSLLRSLHAARLTAVNREKSDAVKLARRFLTYACPEGCWVPEVLAQRAEQTGFPAFVGQAKGGQSVRLHWVTEQFLYIPHPVGNDLCYGSAHLLICKEPSFYINWAWDLFSHDCLSEGAHTKKRKLEELPSRDQNHGQSICQVLIQLELDLLALATETQPLISSLELFLTLGKMTPGLRTQLLADGDLRRYWTELYGSEFVNKLCAGEHPGPQERLPINLGHLSQEMRMQVVTHCNLPVEIATCLQGRFIEKDNGRTDEPQGETSQTNRRKQPGPKILEQLFARPELFDGFVFCGDNGDGLRALVNIGDGLSVPKITVKCIYIDPPYNAGVDRKNKKNGTAYRDTFHPSHWLSLLDERYQYALRLMGDSSAIFTSMDAGGLSRLVELKTQVGLITQGIFTWRRTRTGGHLSQAVNQLTDFVVIATTQAQTPLYGGQADPAESQPLTKAANRRQHLFFPAGSIAFADCQQAQLPAGKTGVGRNPVRLVDDLQIADGYNAHGVRLEGPFVWQQSTLDENLKAGARVVIKRTAALSPRFLRTPQGSKPLPSLADKSFTVGTNEDGSARLQALFGRANLALYPKPVELVKRLIRSSTEYDNKALVLDYFAGSGTCGEAVMELNKMDNGRRRFVLCEQNPKVFQVLVHRLLKVSMAHHWQDGRPAWEQDGRGLGLVVIHLESFWQRLDDYIFSRI